MRVIARGDARRCAAFRRRLALRFFWHRCSRCRARTPTSLPLL